MNGEVDNVEEVRPHSSLTQPTAKGVEYIDKGNRYEKEIYITPWWGLLNANRWWRMNVNIDNLKKYSDLINILKYVVLVLN